MNYGAALPIDFSTTPPPFWMRKDLTPEKNPFKLVDLHPGDTAMDCGGCIGTFTSACLEQGAAHVTVYEAAPKNAVLLRQNMIRYGSAVTVVEAALVATDAKSIDLTLSGFSGANSILPSPTRKKSVTVAAINFRDELLRLRPDVVKIDIEAAEYDLLDSLKAGDLASVRTAFIEFHPIDRRDARIAAIRAFLEAEGFTVLSERRRAFVATRTR